jgi:4'-phosphopantetheinyl transferase EntD
VSRTVPHVVLVADRGQPHHSLWALLSPTEQALAAQISPQRRQRHFVFGRLAAQIAARQAWNLQDSSTRVEIVGNFGMPPIVLVDGRAEPCCISLSHSAHLAVAGVWCCEKGEGGGVDVEQIRYTEIAESDYAFSTVEQEILSSQPESPTLAGLAAWTVKEAVWKAQWPQQACHPAELELRSLDLAKGWASVVVANPDIANSGETWVSGAQVVQKEGRDGPYFLSIAQRGSTSPFPYSCTSIEVS